MSTPTHTETTGDNQTDTKNATDPVPSRVSVTDLLKRETTLSFAGLTPADRHEYPAAVSSETQCHDAEPRSLYVISTLPEASSGELWATNEFVSVDGVVDTDAVRAVPGLDIEELEMATGQSLDEVIDTATADPLVQVRDHQDIVDKRRKALCALGYDVKFRWQIASDRYSIINPQEAYLPIVGALQQRGETEAFGWASYRDWGGLLKLFVVCPGLKQTITGSDESCVDDDTKGGDCSN